MSDKQIVIRCGNVSDAEECWNLANAVALAHGRGSSDSGFLLGTESITDYQRMFDSGFSLIAQNPEGQTVGYVIGYDKGTDLFASQYPPKRVADLGLADFFKEKDRFFHIDKVCVATSSRRAQVASLLYSELFRIKSEETITAFIVEAPVDNTASKAFHGKHKFSKIGAFSVPEMRSVRNVVESIYLRNPE